MWYKANILLWYTLNSIRNFYFHSKLTQTVSNIPVTTWEKSLNSAPIQQLKFISLVGNLNRDVSFLVSTTFYGEVAPKWQRCPNANEWVDWPLHYWVASPQYIWVAGSAPKGSHWPVFLTDFFLNQNCLQNTFFSINLHAACFPFFKSLVVVYHKISCVRRIRLKMSVESKRVFNSLFCPNVKHLFGFQVSREYVSIASSRKKVHSGDHSTTFDWSLVIPEPAKWTRDCCHEHRDVKLTPSFWRQFLVVN